jgi:predicted nucleic-acid-binding protein
MATKPDEAPPRRAFIDTNLLLRFLTNDIPEQADAVERLLRRAAVGEVVLVTNTMVIAEMVWTLTRFYKQPREIIGDDVTSLINSPGLEVEEAELLLEAVNDYVVKKVSFIDAYNAAWLTRHGLADTYTYDRRHYSRFPGIRVLAPE